jgi:hypothetical protein
MFNDRSTNVGEVCYVESEAPTASVHAPGSTNTLPLFKYSIGSKVGKYVSGNIAVGHEIIHQFDNFDLFYGALGYSAAEKREFSAPDEYIWERYTRDGARMSAHCLQIQIATYLYRHSRTFVERYGKAYESAIGQCGSTVIDGNDRHCANCPMFPRRKV